MANTMDSDHVKAVAFVSFLSNVETMSMLVKRGTLSRQDCKDIIDRVLLNLETNQAGFEAPDIAAIQLGRGICEKLLAELDAQDRNRQ